MRALLVSSAFFLCFCSPFLSLADEISQSDRAQIEDMIYDYLDQRVRYDWNNDRLVTQFFSSVVNYNQSTELWARKILKGLKTLREYQLFGSSVMSHPSWVHDQNHRNSFELLRAYIRDGNALLQRQPESVRLEVISYVNDRILPLYFSNPVLNYMSASEVPGFLDVLEITSTHVRRSCGFQLL